MSISDEEESKGKESATTATCDSNKEHNNVDLRIQPIVICTLASEAEVIKGIDRMQPVAKFLHDYVTLNGISSKCFQFLTTKGAISIPGQTRGGELIRKTETVILVYEIETEQGRREAYAPHQCLGDRGS